MTNFKPGDWIISNKHNQANPVKIAEQHNIDTGILGTYCNSKGRVELLYSHECTAWQPQPDEWCWFLSHKNDLPRLRKFISASNPFDRPTVYITEPDPSTEMSRAYCGIESYNYCEPFRGQLPTILKDT